MKTVVLVVFISAVGLALGQDLIYQSDGTALNCTVVEMNESGLKYRLPGETVLVTLSKYRMTRVVLASGREQEYPGLPKIRAQYDWKKVILTTNPDDVVGLTRVKEMKGKSSWGGNMASKGAKRSIQKRAAEIGCPIVLLQDRTAGLMGTRIFGVAYK